MPGSLIPGDLQRIQAHVEDTSGEFVLNHFVASDGAKVAGRLDDGSTFIGQVPTIVPAQRQDGTCVFLVDARCTIHPVSPFGCAYHDVHLGEVDANQRSEFAVLKQLEAHRDPSSDYTTMVKLLDNLNLTASPMMERKQAYLEMINELEHPRV